VITLTNVMFRFEEVNQGSDSGSSVRDIKKSVSNDAFICELVPATHGNT
jgi:hypothetical protein